MPEPLTYGFMQLALAELVLVGLLGAAVGCWIVLFGLSYTTESLAHGMFPGLVGAGLLGAPLIAGGAVGAAGAALAIAAASRVRGLDRDTAVGVVTTTGFGVGVLLALAPASPRGVGDILFGDLLAVAPIDLVVTSVVVVVVLGTLALLHGRLIAVGFDRATAAMVGARPRSTEAILLLLVASGVVAAAQALGSLLVVAAFVAPAATARLVARRVPTLLAVAFAVAVAGAVVGLALSYYARTAAGASVALCEVAAYAVVRVLATRDRR